MSFPRFSLIFSLVLRRRVCSGRMAESILTIREVADLLKINEKTVYKLAAASKIPGMKVGGSWRFDRVTITAWMQRTSATGAASIPDEESETPAEGTTL